MKRFVTCAALVAIAMLACLTAAAKEPLRFNKDGKLKIVQFTDIHWQYGNDSSLEAERNMNAVLDAEKPDLVVITGDLVYSAPARKGIVKALAPTAERGIPFLVAYGNHDSDLPDQLHRQRSQPYWRDQLRAGDTAVGRRRQARSADIHHGQQQLH